jgi:hypothetical protein
MDPVYEAIDEFARRRLGFYNCPNMNIAVGLENASQQDFAALVFIGELRIRH